MAKKRLKNDVLVKNGEVVTQNFIRTICASGNTGGEKHGGSRPCSRETVSGRPMSDDENTEEEGKANVALVMYWRWFVLLGTKGTHETFSRIVRRDLKTSPLHFMGYSVGVRAGVPWVMIAPKRWQRIEEMGREIALHNEKKVTDFFHRFLEKVSGYRFPGVVAQKKKLFAEVNERRRRAGLPRIQVPETWRGRQ